MREIWKDIAGYEGIYQVSNLGNVKSLSFGPKNRKSGTVKLLRQTPSNCGYYKVELYKNGKSKMMYVHRLVATAFIPNPEKKPQVNHIDGNKANNVLSNLEWATSSENQLHAIDHGLRAKSPMLGRTGSNNPNCKAILQYDLSGNFIREWSGISVAARALGVYASSIGDCARGINRTANGSIWKYKESNEYPLKINRSTSQPRKCVYRRLADGSRQMRKIRQLSKEGELIRIWNNYIELVNETGYNNGNIYKAINGKIKSAYGFKWEYEI